MHLTPRLGQLGLPGVVGDLGIDARGERVVGRPLRLDETLGDDLLADGQLHAGGELLGADAYIYGALEGARSDKPIIARVDGRRPPMKGDTVHFTPKAHHVHLFDAETGLRLEA